MEMALVSVANTSINRREQVNFTDFKKIEFQQLLEKYHIDNCIILSTCNRSEVYALAERNKLTLLRGLYASFFAIEQAEICYLQGEAAMQHLLLVTCGLKSTILGEDQIFKQVKLAYQFACVHNMVDKQVHFIFQNLFRIVKEIKQVYRLSEHPRTTSHIAMKLLKRQIPLEQASYLVCGGGEVSKQCLPYIAKAKTIYVALRDMEKQRELQELVPYVKLVPFEQRHVYFQKVDVIISATSSPHRIFHQKDYQDDGKEHWILDLALPRDVDEALYKYPHLHIYNIDDVQNVRTYHEHIKNDIMKEIQLHLSKQAQLLYDVSIQEKVSRMALEEIKENKQVIQ